MAGGSTPSKTKKRVEKLKLRASKALAKAKSLKAEVEAKSQEAGHGAKKGKAKEDEGVQEELQPTPRHGRSTKLAEEAQATFQAEMSSMQFLQAFLGFRPWSRSVSYRVAVGQLPSHGL